MAWYRVGTVNVTNNSNTVTGVGTAWVQAAALGETFLGPDERSYEITAINSNTSLSITPAYKGSTSTAQNYALMPTQGYLRDLAARAAELIASYANIQNTAGEGKFPAGTAAAPSVRGAADGDTGVNFPGSNALELVAGGAVKAKATSAGMEVLGQIKAETADITGNQSTAGTNTHSGLQRVTNTTASTSPTTGAFTLAGGLGVNHAFVEEVPEAAAEKRVVPAGWIYKREREKLRNAHEGAHGGKQTIVWTSKGQANYLYVMPAFNLENIDAGLGAGLHPMFIVGERSLSERLVGVYQAAYVNGELISAPGLQPSVNTSINNFMLRAQATGAGWGLITNADWSGIALWCWKNGYAPNGNTNWGRDSDFRHETGRRWDNHPPGTASGNGLTLTGSGPVSWRHDKSTSGIADLCGNVWELTTGLRLMNFELHVIPQNNAADLNSFATPEVWRAIDGETGEFVAPGHERAVKVAAAGTAPYSLIFTPEGQFQAATNPGAPPVSTVALQKLKSLCLFPVASSGLGSDSLLLAIDGTERVTGRGGNRFRGAGSGLFALAMDTAPSGSGGTIGSRISYLT